MIEEQEKMDRKMKSTEKATKNSQGIANYEDVAYKDGDVSSNVNLPPSLKILKFEKHDGYKDSVKHLGRYCHQLRGTKGKKKENVPIVVTGAKQSSRDPTNNILPPHIYQITSKSKFQSRPEFAKKRKSKNNFIPIEKSYANLFQRLRKLDIITSLLECTPDPYSRNFDPYVRCAYHFDIQGHSIEDCRALKREIERMIQEKLIVVQNIDTRSVTRNPSSTHDNAQYVGINELGMGIQSLFVEENVLESGGNSSHADKQTSG
ncbi:hypothetical protein P3L10_000702 [Capsicum annuum]